MPVRTIHVPVAEVIDGGTKDEFYKDLRDSLATSKAIANLCVTECVKQDDFQKEKCPKIYTYPAVSKSAAGYTNVVSSIARLVEKSYRSKRSMIIKGDKSIRVSNYQSFPWPLFSNKSRRTVSVEVVDQHVEARIKLKGGYWVVRLRGGSNYKRQLMAIKSAVERNAIRDSRIQIKSENKKNIAILGLSIEFDQVIRERSGSMCVSTAIESLLQVTFERSKVPFVINATEVKEWKGWADRKMRMLRQDRKSWADRRRIREEMHRVSKKNQDRFTSLCHSVSSRVVRMADKRKIETIELDFTIKSFSNKFPWFQLMSMISYKAQDLGIKVEDITQSMTEPDLNSSHVYFKLSPLTNRVKIGLTKKTDGSRHKKLHADVMDEGLKILAIHNLPANMLAKKEKFYHAKFRDCRIGNREWFDKQPVLDWLREVGWLGNAGNLSEIMQYVEID